MKRAELSIYGPYDYNTIVIGKVVSKKRKKVG